MERCVQPELLDNLPPADPLAVGSRRDLEKVNASMGNARLMANTLRGMVPKSGARRIVELGAGDGKFFLTVAGKLGADWHGTDLSLVDQASAVSPETQAAFDRIGWRMRTAQADVFDWIQTPGGHAWDAITANLFLHHFSEAQLITLFQACRKKTQLFVAVEPRRSAFCLFISRWLWALGCNRVTRHDAPVSVRAAFAGNELSRLWAGHEEWETEERPAGAFSHLFIARRKM